jgi:hypothetical protein
MKIFKQTIKSIKKTCGDLLSKYIIINMLNKYILKLRRNSIKGLKRNEKKDIKINVIIK